MIISLHTPANWRVVRETLAELARLAHSVRAGANVLVPGPRFAHHSEYLYSQVHFAHPLAETVAELALDGLRRQLAEYGDGGKTYMALLAALVDALAARWGVGEPISATDRQAWATASQQVAADLCAADGPSGADLRQRFVVGELPAVPPAVRNLLLDYFRRAGDGAQLMVVDGRQVEPRLLTVNAYRVACRPVAAELAVEPFTALDDPLVLCLDAQVETPEQLQAVFGPAQTAERACLVLCRGAGELVAPTLAGNFRDQGVVWMVYTLAGEALEDVAALTGTRVHPAVRPFAVSDYGFADRADFDGQYLGVSRSAAVDDPAFLAHVEAVDARRMAHDGAAREALDHRLAMLTGDYWELEVGQAVAADQQWMRDQVQRAAQAAGHLRHGVSGDYATTIRRAVATHLQPVVGGGGVQRIDRALMGAYRWPLPARVASGIWQRAAGLAWLLVSVKTVVIQ